MTDTRDEGVAREARSGPRDAAVRYEDRADRLEWDADLFDALAEFYDAYATSYRGSRSDPHKLTEEDAARLLYLNRERSVWRGYSGCCREDAELLRSAARNVSEDTQRSDSEATPTGDA